MFADYQNLVVRDYQRKKGDNTLPLSLIKPSPAKLKDECLTMAEVQFERNDEKSLKAFFGPFSDKKTCLQAIAKCEIDRFRPLVNFMKGDTSATEEKNIELLAWLIDFQPRPYEFGRKYASREPEPESPKPKDPGVPGPTKPPPTDSGQKAPSTLKKKIIIAALTVIVVIIGAAIIWLQTSRPPASRLAGHGAPALTGLESCMFWDEDHYQPISCTQHGDTLVVASDPNKLTHFKKIMKPDTITTNAIGSVWYARYRGNYEFYTADGMHPIDPNLRLRPITQYIIINHVPPHQ